MAALPALSTLLTRASLTDDEEVLHAANAALKKSKSDVGAQHTRAVALLKLDRFADALRVFDEADDALKQRAGVEWAYALYKSGEFARAEQAVGDAGQGRGAGHVRAQAAYRLEKFERAAELYRGLGDGSAAARGEANDLRINAGAVDAQLEWNGLGRLVRKKKPAREDLEAFETAYNAACGSIARGELGQGEVLLRRAKDLCEALEDLSEEEKKAETLPIVVQQIYVLTRQGEYEDAEKLGESVAISDIPDLPTRHIARVNALAASTQPANPYLSHRLFHSSETLPKTDQPFEFQSAILRQDTYTMDLLSMKFTGVANSTSSYLSTHSSPTTSASTNTVSVLNAAAHAQNRTDKAGLKSVLSLLDKRPDDVGLLLTVIHLYLLTNNHGAATSLLESFLSRLAQSTRPSDQDVRFAPGLVGTLVALYARQARSSHIRTELAKAARYWRHKSKESADAEVTAPVSLLKAAGATLLESSGGADLQEAADIFTALRAHDPADRGTAAGLVAAYAATSRTQEISPDLLEQLTPVARLTADVDAAALEEAGVARSAPVVASADGARKRAAERERERPAKSRKVRKGRMPKEFVEGRPMDPERWLPMRDRSYWKPKGRKGKKRAEGLMQGGLAGEEREREKSAVVAGPGGGQTKKKGKKKGGR